MCRSLVPLALVAAGLALAVPASDAAPRKGERYYFAVTSVIPGDGQPEALPALVRRALEGEIERRDATLGELPKAAPDPKKSPKQFTRYLRKHRLRAFDVRVEVSGYTRTLEPMPDGRSGQLLGVSIALHVFGETIPGRTMAFTGDGSAAIKLEIGSKLRERDEEIAHRDAIELAVSDAVDQALAELRKPPPSKQQKRKAKRRKASSRGSD